MCRNHQLIITSLIYSAHLWQTQHHSPPTPKTSATSSPLQTQRCLSRAQKAFALHYISANVHVGSNIEHIPQDKHTHQKNWGLRRLPSGLVLAGVDADDVALWNTWATVSGAHINKATLAGLGSRSWCRCQCAESHGVPGWHCWVPTLVIWSFYRNWWIPPACLSHGLKATILMWKR